MDAEIKAFYARLEAALLRLASKADSQAVVTDIKHCASTIRKSMLTMLLGLAVGFSGLFMAVKGDEDKPVARTKAPIVIIIPAERLRPKE